MDIRRIELMKALQSEYYGELKRKRVGRFNVNICEYGVHVSPKMMMLYRLSLVCVIGFMLPAIVTIIVRFIQAVS
jgi:hypothetical protein